MAFAITTLYRWIKRYKEEGKSGLSDKSKRPLNLVNTKVKIRFNTPFNTYKPTGEQSFSNDAFQEELHEYFIKFRPIKPRSPHLNGKVERTQQT